jgi:hypothetical protein
MLEEASWGVEALRQSSQGPANTGSKQKCFVCSRRSFEKMTCFAPVLHAACCMCVSVCGPSALSDCLPYACRTLCTRNAKRHNRARQRGR